MTKIKWEGDPQSLREEGLRDALDSLSKSSSWKGATAKSFIAKACLNCPFRYSGCDFASNNNPAGRLAQILAKGTEEFPNVPTNRRNLRKALDNPKYDFGRTTCEQALLGKSAIREVAGSLILQDDSVDGSEQFIIVDYPLGTYAKTPEEAAREYTTVLEKHNRN